MKIFSKLIGCLVVAMLTSHSMAQFDSGRADLSVIVNNEIYPYREFATFVLPAENLEICIIHATPDAYTIEARSGRLDKIEDCRWIWTAPDEPGLIQLNVVRSGSSHLTLNVFVMIPANKVVDGMLDGYLIGEYPDLIDESPIYLEPEGYVQVTQDMLGVNVSPNFKLGQFLERIDGQYPKYIVLRERLLLKLEVLLEYLNELGIVTDSLSIARGFIPPAQNQAQENTDDARHIYGGAVSFMVDADGDSLMDDIDGNGELEAADGVVLFNIIDELFSNPGKEYLKGGLHLYDYAAHNTSLIMMDARGFRKRWENDSEIPDLPQELRLKHKQQFE